MQRTLNSQTGVNLGIFSVLYMDNQVKLRLPKLYARCLRLKPQPVGSAGCVYSNVTIGQLFGTLAHSTTQTIAVKLCGPAIPLILYQEYREV